MPRVWLVGSDNNGCRTLLSTLTFIVNIFQDVVEAFQRRGWGLVGSTGYVLQDGDARSPIDTCGKVEASQLGDLPDDLTLLYIVTPQAVGTCTEARLRQQLNTCLASGSTLNGSRKLLIQFGMVAKLGNNKMERLWHENLIQQDIGFLLDSREARAKSLLYLLHDLCPVTADKSDNRKLGHLTVAYAKGGKKHFHTVSVYLAVSGTGEAQDGQIQRVFEHFQKLCEVIDDGLPLTLDQFASSFRDRGASLGKFDAKVVRLMEPVHRVHLTTKNVIRGCDATYVIQCACNAANMVATSAEFQAFLVKRCPSVTNISGLLWQRATTGRFGTAPAACLVLVTRIEGKPLYAHLLDFFASCPKVLEHSKQKRKFVECFKDELECKKMEYQGRLFACVYYPIYRASGVEGKRQTNDITFQWQERFFLSVAHTLATVAKKPSLLRRIDSGECDAFGSRSLCRVDPTTCTFQKPKLTKLPEARRITAEAVLNVLPPEVKTAGVDKYFGNRGVRSPLIPAVSLNSSLEFLEASFTRIAVSCYAEVKRYPVPDVLKKKSCDIHLGPVLVEGICGRAKRVTELCQHARIRDECIRAFVCCHEKQYATPGLQQATLVKARRVLIPERSKDRKARLGRDRLTYLNEESEKSKKKMERKTARQEKVAKQEMFFSFNQLSKVMLMLQVVKRGGKGKQRLCVEELRNWLTSFDNDELPLDTLTSEAEARGLPTDQPRETLLKMFRDMDEKSLEQSGRRKRKRNENTREVSESDLESDSQTSVSESASESTEDSDSES
eukprot:Hpha_TRINITY_DN11114_c0_g2::TRINITY_DN11114_c0_g2_i1::g.28117::m.28117